MLNGYDEDLNSIDFTLPAEQLKAQLSELANKRAEGLANKNGDVIGSNTLLKAQVKQLEDAAHSAKLKAAEEANDIVELNRLNTESAARALTTAEERALSLEGENKGLKGNLTKLLIDGGLSDALDGVKINPALKVGAVSMLRANATISDGQAMIGDKSLSDAVKEWAASDTGKAYCLAPQNSGGDALGGGGNSASKTFSEMSLTERTVLANTDPQLYQQMQGK